MSREFPDWVDPVRAASGRREFQGTVPLARLERLHGLLADDKGEAEFRLKFSFDEQRQVRVEVRVKARPNLVCQRTLKTFGHPVVSSSTLGIVADERAVEGLPGDYEPVICVDQRLALMHLVEEELLLALPVVPRSPTSEPVRPEAPSGRQQPFAVLADLKRERDPD